MSDHVPVPAAVDDVLRRACYDCHSSETRWPWYSRIAPLSWWIGEHVRHGRTHVDFSDWSTDPDIEPTPMQRVRWICTEIQRGTMPLPSYLLAHRDARLSADDAGLVCDWSSETARRLTQVDPEWLRTWRRTDALRPTALQRESHIGPATEPGSPLVITGRIVEPDGRTPARGVVVFAYQTDGQGLYFAPGAEDGPWRMRGWARTDTNGEFEFRTVRPAPYPGRTVPAHVHFTFVTERFGRQWTRELRFADDPLVTEDARRQSAADAPYGEVHEVRLVDGIPHITFMARLKPQGDF